MYLLDSDVLIEAKNRHYGFEICPGFWEWLDRAHADGIVCSVEKVQEELEAGQDELTDWAKARPAFFLNPDERVVAGLTATSAWLNTSRYDGANRTMFLQAADYYLVGHAYGTVYTVVTHERPSTGKKVKIPDACNAMQVKWASLWTLLHNEGVRFVLP